MRWLRLAFALSVLAAPPAAAAGEDPRFSIRLVETVQPGLPTAQALRKAVRTAAERLWQRILPADLKPPAIDPVRFVREVRRTSEGWLIRFDRKRTLQWLKAQGLHPIETPPAFAITVRALGPFGEDPSLAFFLQNELSQIAARIGIVLSADGRPVELTVLWSSEQIGVLLGKEPMIHRPLATGEDLRVAASGLLHRALLMLRDRWALRESTPSSARLWLRLTIERESPLAEQLDWEQALQAARIVHALLPTELGPHRRSYLVGLASEEEIASLQRWLQQQGSELHPMPLGWRVR